MHDLKINSNAIVFAIKFSILKTLLAVQKFISKILLNPSNWRLAMC